MVELNTPYSAKELCEKLFGISYDSFRQKRIKDRYLKALGEAYDYKYEKRKYILIK